MTRFILANRRAGKFSEASARMARHAADRSFSMLFAASADVMRDIEPDDPLALRIVTFEADLAEVDAKRQELPANVILEPVIPHYPVGAFAPIDLKTRNGVLPASFLGKGLVTTVRVFDASGQGLAGVSVRALFSGPGNVPGESESITPASGVVSIEYSNGWRPRALIVEPYASHWPMFRRAPWAPTVDVVCPPIPAGSLGWWHAAVGQSAYDPGAGEGIRIGVIDSGCGPHPDLGHVTLVDAFVQSVVHSHAGASADIETHGTHICGTIGARPSAAGHAGIAPGAELFAARVRAVAGGPADQDDLALAIEALSEVHRADLINLSFAADQRSDVLHDAILVALDRGTLCICAAGNEAPRASGICYPAALDECVSVSALGDKSWTPPGTLSATRVPTRPDMFGNGSIYLANFSCFGSKLTTSAPGVGIIAPVPEQPGFSRPYAVMDGSSMAAPVTCGALAVQLARDPLYLSAPRNRARAESARQKLTQSFQDQGLSSRYQGGGTPRS